MASIITIEGQVWRRRDTAANWTANNPILPDGQMGYETDTLKIKFGDGSTAWNSLSYAGAANGYLQLNYAAKTANYTIGATDYVIECTSNTFNITLLTAVGRTGQVYVIKNSGTGVITILTTSAQTIDGNASGSISLGQYDSLTVQSNGTNWIIIGIRPA